jgi:hypothetical protein
MVASQILDAVEKIHAGISGITPEIVFDQFTPADKESNKHGQASQNGKPYI